MFTLISFRKILGLALLGALTAVAGSAWADAMTQPAGDVVAVVQQSSQFSTFAKLVKASGLARTLKSGQYTVFAPTDDAFAKLPAGTVDGWLKPANKEKLVSLVKYHIVARTIPSSDFAQTSSQVHNATTLDRRDITFRSDNNEVLVNDAKLLQADIKADNGLIHAIDTVLTPPSR